MGARLFFACRLFVCLGLLLLTLVPMPAQAEPSVRVDVDRTEMDPGDLVTLVVTATTDERNAEISDPILPDLSSFEIVKQWTTVQSRGSVVMTQTGPQFQSVETKTFNYMLQPLKQGRLSISGIQVNIGANRFVTSPKSVNVIPGGSGAPPSRQAQRGQAQPNVGRGGGGGSPSMPPGFPPDLFDDEDDLFAQLLRRQGVLPQQGHRSLPNNANEIFFVQVETDKTSVYQDEQVTASWYLYTRGQIRDLDTLKYPSLTGFWKEDIEIATQLNFQHEVINGVPYRKALLASFALFPIKDGVAVIDSYKVRCNVDDSIDPFGMFGGGQVRQYTKASQPIKVQVKPLPTEGRPADFSGAVGTFQVSARVEDPNVVVGEPFSMRIRFEGKGNAKRIDLPPLNLPEALEVYETQKEAKFFRTGTSYRDFNVLLIPRQEGDITIPPISTSIFDPVSGKYVTAVTEPITVRAARGAGGAKTENSRLADAKKKEPKEQEPGIATEFEHLGPFRVGYPVAFYPALFSVIGALLLWRARSELGWGQRKRDMNRRLQARFRKVNERVATADWRGVGVEITNTVYFVLGEISGQGGANVELEKLMLRAPPSVRRELAEPVMKLMDSFQALSFAPDEVVRKLNDPGQVKKLVSEMQALMEKAVALGLNAERDGASSRDPRAS